MAWKLVNLPMDLIKKLEAYMKRQKIEVYWRAIEELLEKESTHERPAAND